MYTDILGRRWYKGNLHAHTTLSDGKLKFDEAVSRYRYLGYDFLAVTDHWVTSSANVSDGFLLLSGCEYDTDWIEESGGVRRKVVIHINGIGFAAPPRLEKNADLRGQHIIDGINAAGGIAILNHPEWSRNLVSDIQCLKGLAGMEIYNTVCGFCKNGWHHGYSGFHADQLALQGINMPAFAADDAHFYSGEEGRSFIMVNAESLTEKDIMAALREGRFYASQGPWVQVEVSGRKIKVTSTPVTEIKIYSNKCGGWAYWPGQLVTGLEYELPEGAYYYRIEVTDEKGNQAWTSPARCQSPPSSSPTAFSASVISS
jgi:hypothetical protein